MVWCGTCYIKEKSDIFQVNDPMDEDVSLIYDYEIYASRYKFGIDGSHLMGPF